MEALLPIVFLEISAAVFDIYASFARDALLSAIEVFWYSTFWEFSELTSAFSYFLADLVFLFFWAMVVCLKWFSIY